MSWSHPWVLLALPLLAGWMVWEWRRTGRHGALALKVLMAALVVAALAEPRLTVFEERVGLVMLTDTSASIPPEDLQRESELVERLRSERGRHSLQVLAFAGETRELRPEENGNRPALRSEGRVTNLETALRNAISLMPQGRVPRVLLATDGQENAGSVERAIYQAKLLAIPVDTFALAGTPEPALRLEAVSLPSQAFTGERFYIEVAVTSPRAASGAIEITADEKPIGRSEIKLQEGENTFRVRAQLEAVGATHVSGRISAGELGQVRFDRVVALRQPRLLLITRESVEESRHLRQVLHAARFALGESSGALPENLRDYQVVLANNHDVESWTPEQKRRLEEYVREGGGFLLIGGGAHIYAEKQPDDALARMLPAELAPPRTPEGTAVVLIIDKSSSMEGRKMELARVSAIGVVQNLRPIDQVGILIFDNSYQWVVPIRRADNPALLRSLISGITPDGGTQIAPALAEAFRQVRRMQAVYRHVVLLTDGISEEGDSMATAREAAAMQVTISTVGLGQDVNRNYLERVATLARGKSYFVLDYSNLEQILVRDVMEHTGTSAVERPVQVAVVRNVELLEDVPMAQAPPLLGYLKFVAKPEAETILQADGRDPLLTRWQYGLGRAAVYASDAKPQWAANWVTWPGFDRLFMNLLRDLLPRAQETEATVDFDKANNEIVVNYRLRPGVAAPASLPDLFALGPDNFRKVAAIRRITASSYQARVPIDNRQGLFRIRPAAEERAFPEVGYYREEVEMTRFGSSPLLLQQIAAVTGGRFNPTPQQAFEAGNRSVPNTLELWPGLLALAVLLNLLELAARKGYTPRRLWAR